MELSKISPNSWNVERRRFIDAGGNTTHSFGLGRMIGRVYSLLYLTTDAICLDDIATQLNVSKASVSIVVRQLSEWQAVHRLSHPGDRRDFYEAQTDFLLILKRGVMPGLRKKLQSAGSQIGRALAAGMPASTTEGQEVHPESGCLSKAQQIELHRRLRTAQNWHRRIDRLLASKLLSRFL